MLKDPRKGRVRAWLRALAPRDLDRGLEQIRVQTTRNTSKLPLGSAWLHRDDLCIDLTCTRTIGDRTGE